MKRIQLPPAAKNKFLADVLIACDVVGKRSKRLLAMRRAGNWTAAQLILQTTPAHRVGIAGSALNIV